MENMKRVYNAYYPDKLSLKSLRYNGIILLSQNKFVSNWFGDLIIPRFKIKLDCDVIDDEKRILSWEPGYRKDWDKRQIKSNRIKAHIDYCDIWVNNQLIIKYEPNSMPVSIAYYRKDIAIYSVLDNLNILEIWRL